MKFNVTYGGWYQRTTLHLSEIYDLFAGGKSNLKLSETELEKYKKNLSLESVSRESDYFEYVKSNQKDGIEIRYYEDGLYILTLETENITEAQKKLEKYYEEKFNPAVSYIFSLGAPTPKILANIKTKHPVVVSVHGKDAEDFTVDEKVFGKVYSRIKSEGVTVEKTPEYIFIIAPNHVHSSISNLIEMQIFFREFKDQLEKYLSIHRTIWEQISDVKEAKTIVGKEVDSVRGKLDGYQKTISLIGNRINQMGSYINTRSSIAKHYDIEKSLIDLFEYKFETLTDTLSYIKEIWKMTGDYLSQAISNLVEIKNQSTSNNLKSLQTITSIGVISGVLGYLSANKLPSISKQGLIYFLILFCLTWGMNAVIAKKYRNKKYSLKFGDRADEI